MNILIPTAYWGPVQQYAWMQAAETVWVEQAENYQKQTYRNRCIIAAAGGVLPLTVPIVKPEKHEQAMAKIRISDHGNWRHLHWQALTSAYKNSPFFEYYEDDFRPFYTERWEYLLEYNQAIDRKIRELLDIEVDIQPTEKFSPIQPLNLMDETVDLRGTLNPKQDVIDSYFQPQPYYQVFQQKFGFTPNLSIADLLFNMGPESILVLQASLIH